MSENNSENDAPAECPCTCISRAESLRAFFLVWAIETALGFLIFVIMFGNVAYPMYKAVSTSGWDSYSILLWGFLGMVALAAFMVRVLKSAKEGFQPVFG